MDEDQAKALAELGEAAYRVAGILRIDHIGIPTLESCKTLLGVAEQRQKILLVSIGELKEAISKVKPANGQVQ